MLTRFTFLMTFVVLVFTFASSKSQAQFPRNTGLKTPADRAVGDLAWPDVSQWHAIASGGNAQPLISEVEAKIADLLHGRTFEGRGCDLTTKTRADFFPQAKAQMPVVVSSYANSLKSEYLFSISSPDGAYPHSQTTMVRLNAEESAVTEFIGATCHGTKTMGLQDACIVTSFCRAK